MSTKIKQLGLLGIISMTFLTVFGFSNIPNLYMDFGAAIIPL